MGRGAGAGQGEEGAVRGGSPLDKFQRQMETLREATITPSKMEQDLAYALSCFASVPPFAVSPHSKSMRPTLAARSPSGPLAQVSLV